MADKTKIEIAILCDDVRFEKNNKPLLLGVYPGDILVPELPAALLLCVFVSIRGLERGDHEFQLRITASDSGGEMGGIIHVEDPNESAAVATPKLPLRMSKPSKVKVDLRLGAGRWRTIIEKAVRLLPANPTT